MTKELKPPEYKICTSCWLSMPWREDGRQFHHRERPYACQEHNEVVVVRADVAEGQFRAGLEQAAKVAEDDSMLCEIRSTEFSAKGTAIRIAAAIHALATPPPLVDGWQPIETAPKDARWLQVQMADGTTCRAHYAQGDGENQPSFRGWFIQVGSGQGSYFTEIDSPVKWRPDTPQPVEEQK